MLQLKEVYPYIDGEGIKHENLILHYAENANGENYYIKQVETGIEYESAIDVYPCRYAYEATNKVVERIKNYERQESVNEVTVQEIEELPQQPTETNATDENVGG